jgi:hypothetical protein
MDVEFADAKTLIECRDMRVVYCPLHAAAPGLLQACKAALGAFEHNNAIDWNDLVRAIEKAEGKA